VKKNGFDFYALCIFEWFMFFLRKYFVFFRLLLMCGFANAQKMSTHQYITDFKYAAMQEMKVYGIPASVTLAQGILESASGNSELASECNNHFGIKCRKNWTGNFCLADDDAPDECFRGYSNAMESYRDHSLFLKGSSRYDFLFGLPATDYKAWAHGLRQAGYATNPAYGNIIIGVVERYRLSMYDSMTVLGEDYLTPDTAAGRLIQLHGLPALIASKNQKPEDIARLYDMGVWQIYKYNDLKSGESLQPGEIVYLKPKRRKGGDEFHFVKQGESLRDISQQHAVKLKHLEKFNQIPASQPLRPGEIIFLREKRRKDSVAAVTTAKTTVINFTADTIVRIANEGDTWEKIASAAGKSGVDLKKNNAGLENPVPGQVVLITTGSAVPRDQELNTGSGKGLIFHTVLAGETVYSICRLYKIATDSLLLWNGLTDSKIRIGQELRVERKVFTSQKVENQTHTVCLGETLYQISRKYGVSVSDIQRKNGLKGNEIKAGQVLIIE
jgi:LysM repeat protein